MHAIEMLLEIVQARPLLVRAWAVLAKAEIHHLWSAFRLLIVHALLVTGQVIDRAKSLFSRAVGLVTFEQFSMASLVFPSQRVSVYSIVKMGIERRSTSYQMGTFRPMSK
jgi:uncharacterized membrane protein